MVAIVFEKENDNNNTLLPLSLYMFFVSVKQTKMVAIKYQKKIIAMVMEILDHSRG